MASINTSIKNNKSSLPSCGVTAPLVEPGHAFKIIYSSFLVEYERVFHFSEESSVVAARLSNMKKKLSPLYKASVNMYVNPDESWAYIVEEDEVRHSAICEVFKRYRNDVPSSSFSLINVNLEHLMREIVKFDILNVPRLSSANAKSRVKGLKFRVNKNIDLTGIVLVALHCCRSDKDVKYLMRILNQFLSELHCSHWVEVGIFRRFIQLVCSDFIFRPEPGLRPEGFLGNVSSAFVPPEIDTLVSDLRGTNLKVNNFLDSAQEKISQICDSFSTVMKTIMGESSFISTIYTERGNFDGLTPFVEAVIGFFSKVGKALALVDLSVVVDFFLDCLTFVFRTFDRILQKYVNNSPFYVRVILLSVTTTLFLQTEEEATVQRALLAAVTGYLASSVFMSVQAHKRIIPAVIRVMGMILNNKGYILSITGVVAIVLKEVCGVALGDHCMRILNLVPKAPRYFSGIMSCLSFVGAAWNKLVYTYVEENPDLESLVLHDKTDALYRDAHEHVKTIQETLARYPVTDSAAVGILQAEYEALDKLVKSKYPKELGPYNMLIQQVLSRAKTYVLNAKKFGVDLKGPRQEPVCVLITGEPGSLKSTFALFVNSLMQECIKGRTCSNEELIKDTFAVNIHSDYWEGYENQSVVIMDDFMQIRESVGDASSSSKVIEMVNSMPTPLNMAELTSKGAVYFNSKAVILTTNIKQITSEAIESPEALARRIHIYLEVSVKDEFKSQVSDIKNGAVDPTKLPRGPKGELITPLDMWNITLYRGNGKRGEPTNPIVISFRDVKRLIQKNFELKQRIFNSLELNLQTFMSEISHLEGPFTMDRYEESFFDCGAEYQVSPISSLDGISSTKLLTVQKFFQENDVKDSGVRDICDSAELDTKEVMETLYKTFEAFDTVLAEAVRTCVPTHGVSTELMYLCSRITDPQYLKWVSADHLKISLESKNIPTCVGFYCNPALNKISWVNMVFTRGLDVLVRRDCSPVVNYVRKHPWACVGGATAIATVLFALLQIRRLWLSPVDIIEQDNILEALNEDRLLEMDDGFTINSVPFVESSAKVKSKLTKAKERPVPVKVSREMRPEGDLPLSAVSRNHLQVIEKVQKNLCAFLLASVSQGPLKILSNALFINDRVVMFNKHNLDILDCIARRQSGVYYSVPDMFVCFTTPCSIDDFEDDSDNSLFESKIIGPKAYDLEAFYGAAKEWGKVTGDDDLIIFPVPANSGFKSIVHLFMSEADYEAHPEISYGIIAARKGHNNVVTNLTVKRMTDTSIANFEGYGLIPMRKSLHYTYSLGPGSCGSPLFLINKGMPCVAGIHAAGSVGEDKSTIARAITVSRDSLLAWIQTLSMKPQGDMHELVFYSEKNDGPRCPMNTSSSIVPTLLNQWCSELITKKPARLTPFVNREGVRVDPFIKAYSRYGCGEYSPFEDVLSAAVNALKLDLSFILNEDRFRIEELDWEDSIQSVIIDGDSVPSIARGTSVGYPYNVTLCRSKKTLWGEEGDFDFTSPEWSKLFDILKEQDDLLRKGIRPSYYFQDCLKDETLPIAKVDEGRTRMFSACPVDYLVMFRRYFLPFTTWMVRTRLKHPSAVGINPTSNEWDGLARYLCKFAQPAEENFLDGDFSRFDASQKTEVFKHIYGIVDHLYSLSGEKDEVRRRIRSILWKEVYASIHVYADRKVFWDGALPSGHPMTSLINSLYNSVSFYYSWHRACMEAGYALDAIPSFQQNISLIVFGDDNVIGVSQAAKEILRAGDISKYMAELGLTYTAVSKDDSIQYYKRLEECTFLKRAFRLEPTLGNSWVAPLNLESLINSLMWRKKTFPERDHYKFVGETFLNELSLHDESVYEIWSKWLVDHLIKLGIVTRRVELDRYLRLRHVMSSFDSLYEYTDAYLDRYEALKRGARLFEQDDLLRIESCSYIESMVDENDGNIFLYQTMNMDNLMTAIDETIKNQVLGNGNSHPFSGSNCSMRPEAEGEDTSRSREVTVTTATTVTSDVPADSQHGPTANFVSADSTMLTEVLARDIPISFEDSQSMGVIQSLEDFFAKPVLLHTGSLTTTDGPSTVFPQVYLPYDAQQVDMWKDKLKGFMSMKFDVVIRLQVNSTRFQQGRYMLYFVPFCGGSTGVATTNPILSTADAWLMMHSANTTNISQLPHVELDVATQSEAVLRVPYINADPFTPLLPSALAPGAWGSVSIFPYAKLVAVAGSTDASFSVWYSLENVRLYTPTIPQGDIERRERKGDGPITSGLKTASKVSSVLGRIPILKAIAGPTSFFLDVASDVARVFGWSRPQDISKVERRLLAVAPYACNFDSPSFGMPLTNCVDTSVGNLPNFAGSDLDEMVITAFVTRYSYLTRYTWSTSSLAKDNLAHIAVYPWGAYRAIVHSSPSVTYKQHTTVSFVADMFRFWRGSMKYKFKLVKTEFHSGRLMVTFVPFDYRQTPPVTTTLTTNMERYASKTIVDISSTVEFEVIVPFISNTPWAEYNNAIGFLDVFVLDPLKAPNTVSSSITLLLEVAMCPDAQFNDYHSENLRTPFVPVYRYEGADVVEGVTSSNIIGGGGTVVSSDNAAQYCMGDMVLSFRSLLKRPHYILMTDATRTALPGVVSQTAGFQTFCAPYRVSFACCTTVAGVDTLVFPSTGANDLYSLLSCCFALSRGSMVCEIHIPPSTANANTVILRKNKDAVVGPGVTNPTMRAAAACGNTGNASYSGYNGMRNGSAPLIAYNAPNNAHFQVKTDCYNRSFSRPVYSMLACDNLNMQFVPNETSATSYAPAVVVCASTSASQIYSWTRFGGDDFSLGYFICIPPVLDIPDIAQDLSY